MRYVFDAVLIATLGLLAGACTIVTDPSSGSSGSSGDSKSTEFRNRQQQLVEFASVNLDWLKHDMAVGQGEYLSALAALLNIEPSQQPAFFAFTKEKFPVLFADDRTTATDMLATLTREMQVDQRFAPRLTLN